MSSRDENVERITRLAGLADTLSRQLEAAREESRVIASTLQEHAIVQNIRARARQRAADVAKLRADIRAARTARITRRKRG